jgi:tetratricopeptide (TPR) repeat protein
MRPSQKSDLGRRINTLMTNSNEPYSRDSFVACEWSYDVLPKNHYGYYSVMESLEKSAQEKLESGQEEQGRILTLLSKSTSMTMVPSSLNDPFKPHFQDYQAGKRSALPEDFTVDELSFFEEILNDVTEPWLKARLADLLWLCKTPKSPSHAKIAIESYISHDIDSDTWYRGVNNCWERAARLCMQLGDFDKLDVIKSQLFSSFELEYPSSKFMPLWIAGMMDKLNIDSDLKENIASKLFKNGNKLLSAADFDSARSYFELSSKKYNQAGDEKGWLDSLVSLANCFEQEADSRSGGSNMAANLFYEKSIQAYRQIPTKHRDNYNISDKIKEIRRKISSSGKASLDEMGMIETPGIDISDAIKASRAHIAGRRSLEEALMCFSGLYPGPKNSQLQSSAKKTCRIILLVVYAAPHK